MKKITMPRALFGLLMFSVLWMSCSKENSTQVPVTETAVSQSKVSGVVDDDPVLQAKVPLIISAGYLAEAPNANSEVVRVSMIAARGKRDAIAPTVSILSPSAGATVSGTIAVTVNAADDVAVASVSLAVDGVTITSSSTAPFTNTWNTATVTNGTHTITVTARDAAGNKTSSAVQVSVSNAVVGDITAPTVNITSPANGASYNTGTTITINASGSDNVAVTSTSISINGAVVGSSSSSAYSYSWNTTSAASGIYTITALAKDAAGNQATKSISVTLNTTVIQPPSTSGFSLTMPPVGNQGSEGSCVAFSVGYSARSAEQYYRTGATSYSFATNIFSPEFLYNQIKFSSDCYSGSAMQTALEFVKTNGIATFQTMPYSSSNGCSLLPTVTQTTEAQNYKIASYSKLYTNDKAAIKALVTQKHPVIVTILADNSFISAKAGFIWKVYSGSGSLTHSVVICGYDDAKNAYLVQNSWGTGWCDAGYGWIDYDFLPTRSGTYCYAIN